MQTRARIVAGTALALVMAAYAGTAQAGSPPLPEGLHAPVLKADINPGNPPLLLAQATDEEEQGEERPRREREDAPAEEQPEAETPAEEPPAEQAPVEEPPAEEAPAQEEPAQEAPAQEEPTPEQPAAEEPAEQPQAAPATPEPEAPAAEEPAAQEPEQAPAEAAPEAPADAAPEQPAEAPAETPAQDETDRAAEPVPAPADAQESEPTPPQQEATPPAAEGTPPQPEERPADSGAEPVPPPPASDAQPPAEDTAPPAEGTTPPTQEGAEQPADSSVEPVTGDSREAPILDSAKEDPAAEGQSPAAEGQAPAAGEQQQEPAEAAAPPPTSDAEAQRFEEPVEIQSLRAEEGRRIEGRELRRERREGADVLREIGDRVVIQLGGQVIVRSDERRRVGRDASEVYYEELPRGRTRETVVRANGVQVVTVYDRYGDVIRRARVLPDGREHILVYAGDRDRDRDGPREWRDPAQDLPPLRLRIPRDEYILDAGRVRDEGSYYDFLAQPPVEQVRRPYSVDEVRYSARVRDSVRRVDLDTITFDFGSATISEDAIPRLEGVAQAMERLLERNPGEVFLIEGHTDAVGSDQANLALSDRRAEAIATAMTDVFGIPPENLVTQGYGERYLKINTEEPEQENRRVAIRRITPLVAPVASNEQ